MRKYVYIAAFSFISITALGQSAKIKIKKRQPVDTINLLQGIWNFSFATIVNKPKSAEAYTVTDLEITGNKFVMRFSEAADGGQIDKKFNFVFNHFCDDYRPNDTCWCKNMTIYKLKKDELILLKNHVTTSGFFKKQNGHQDVLFHYKK